MRIKTNTKFKTTVTKINQFDPAPIRKFEEKELENDIFDLKRNIKLNWDIIFDLITNSKDDFVNNLEAKDLINKTKLLLDSNLTINKEIADLKKERLNVMFADKFFSESFMNEFKKEEEKNKLLQEQLTKKKAELSSVESSLKNARKRTICDDPEGEVYIVPPTKKILELQQEILSSLSVIKEIEYYIKQDSLYLNNLKINKRVFENEIERIASNKNSKKPIILSHKFNSETFKKNMNMVITKKFSGENFKSGNTYSRNKGGAYFNKSKSVDDGGYFSRGSMNKSQGLKLASQMTSDKILREDYLDHNFRPNIDDLII